MLQTTLYLVLQLVLERHWIKKRHSLLCYLNIKISGGLGGSLWRLPGCSWGLVWTGFGRLFAEGENRKVVRKWVRSHQKSPKNYQIVEQVMADPIFGVPDPEPPRLTALGQAHDLLQRRLQSGFVPWKERWPWVSPLGLCRVEPSPACRSDRARHQFRTPDVA